MVGRLETLIVGLETLVLNGAYEYVCYTLCIIAAAVRWFWYLSRTVCKCCPFPNQNTQAVHCIVLREAIAGYREALFPLRGEDDIRVCMLHPMYHSGRGAAVLVFTAICMQVLTFSKSKYIFHRFVQSGCIAEPISRNVSSARTEKSSVVSAAPEEMASGGRSHVLQQKTCFLSQQCTCLLSQHRRHVLCRTRPHVFYCNRKHFSVATEDMYSFA